MKNIVVIPARGGSKRLPEKNIKMLGGKPLLTHSIDYAKTFDFIDDIVVSTDCNNIKEVAKQSSVRIIDRPAELAGDFTSTVEVLQHAVTTLNLDKDDNIILLQATNPLRPKKLLEEAMKIYTTNSYNSLFTVSRDTHKLGKIKGDKFIPFNYEFGMRSQDMEPLYYENGLLYITKKQLIDKGIIMNEESYPLFVEGHLGNIDIDDQYDFDFAEFVLSKLL
ncbi:acylneuraminate cytidylyltransferase family protein [Ornithobacterium rhinotracheale]|uniref:acylneuraminate cytidylyltransferase family protein n=1 Tax=Ornithobacterium rhinotracheale TaxID=28251 RepID=UPI00129C6819|nr:acylneuraminate cytidylyltransferase family protein [Ornithobacterium rhinotracheale]MRI62417.1 acylneuraminate cytidylyltransferase family protein [Ornithobacterium rhinotracheale]